MRSDPLVKQGRRFGRRMERKRFTAARLHKRLTAEQIVEGEAERQALRRTGQGQVDAPRAYLDLWHYVYRQGWARSHSEARRLGRRGKINVHRDGHWEVWAYQHYPQDELEYDDRGRPRIMIEGREDPR